MHALWIEWRQTTLQTTALLALAGVLKETEPDVHVIFDDAFSPPRQSWNLTPQEREERRARIARLAGG